MPTPATTRVVQMEPCPILIVLAPASARNSTPSLLDHVTGDEVRVWEFAAEHADGVADAFGEAVCGRHGDGIIDALLDEL